MLEATTARLEARVRELERGGSSTSIPLIVPYEGSQRLPPISIHLSSPRNFPNPSPRVAPANFIAPRTFSKKSPDALLSAVYLWCIHLSQSEALSSREHVFLERVLQHSASNGSSNHPQKISMKSRQNFCFAHISSEWADFSREGPECTKFDP